MSKWQDYTRHLVAGVEQRIEVSGDYFHVQSAASALQISFDGGEWVTREQTQGEPSTYRSHVRLRSATTQAVTISLGDSGGMTPVDGRARFTGVVNAVIDKVASRPTYPDALIPAGSAVRVAEAEPLRISLAVQLPEDAPVAVRVGDSLVAANRGLILGPGGAVSAGGSPEVWVFNPGVVAVSVALIAEHAP